MEVTGTITEQSPLGQRHWKKLEDPELFSKLVAKAHELLLDKYWGNGAIPNGADPESLALDAIEDVMLGTVEWDPDVEPDPYLKLARMLRSKVSNIVRSSRNRAVPVKSEDESVPYSEPAFDRFLQEAAEISFFEKVNQCVSGNPDLVAYIRAASICSKRSEIATQLGLTPDEVTNLQKRVRRILSTTEFATVLFTSPVNENEKTECKTTRADGMFVKSAQRARQ